MADLISFPFRISPGGSVVTRPENSTDYYAELLSVLLLTKPGERQQVPLFGVTDPTFSTLERHELASKVDMFGPPVSIVSLTTKYVSDTKENVLIEFTTLV